VIKIGKGRAVHQTAYICSKDLHFQFESKENSKPNHQGPDETRKQLLYEFTENIVKRSTLD